MGVEENEESPRGVVGAAAPMVAHGLTHTGKRERNEDHHSIREELGIAVVADGWSGARGGERAARLAVEHFVSYFDAWEDQTLPDLEALDMRDGVTIAMARFAVEQANRHVAVAARHGGPPGMAAAMGAFLMTGPRVILAYAGCVQAYRFRGTGLERLTKIESSNAVPSYPVGARTAEKPAVVAEHWRAGDVYILCTSGLHQVLSHEEIRCALACCPSLAESAAALVGRALHAGATDNMTVVVLRPVRGDEEDSATRWRGAEIGPNGRGRSE